MVLVLSGNARRALGTAFRIGRLAGVAVRARARVLTLADLADGAHVAFLETRLVAKLTGNARQA